MQVMKFGGTSVQDATAINRVIEILRQQQTQSTIVVSAFATITNHLSELIESLKQQNISAAESHINYIHNRHLTISQDLNLESEIFSFIEEMTEELKQIVLASKILGEVTPRSIDSIMSYGERLSSYIIYHAMKNAGISISHIDARQIIKTDSNYSEAEVRITDTTQAIEQFCKPLFSNHDVVITGGFIGSDSSGNTTTLGRGGSDYSAAIIAAALNADRLEIWTDVDGIMTSDPRIIHDAKQILCLTYDEAAELAYFGAKVLHPKTIYPAVENQIPVFVKNTFNPDFPGTKIINFSKNNKMIKAIAFRPGITVININSNRMLGAYGFLSNFFNVFEKHKTSVDLVTTSEVNISLTVDDDKNLPLIISDLNKFAKISVQKEMAIISAIGEGIRNTAGISSRLFGVLKGINISMVSIGASEVNLSIIVNENDMIEAIRLLHNEFLASLPHSEIFREITKTDTE